MTAAGVMTPEDLSTYLEIESWADSKYKKVWANLPNAKYEPLVWNVRLKNLKVHLAALSKPEINYLGIIYYKYD